MNGRRRSKRECVNKSKCIDKSKGIDKRGSTYIGISVSCRGYYY